MTRCAPQVMLRSVQFLEVLGGEILRKMWRKQNLGGDNINYGNVDLSAS